MSDTTTRQYKQVRDLIPGDRFLTPGGRRLTVALNRWSDRTEAAYREIVTVEQYAPGEWFTAPGHREVEVA